MSPFDIIKSFHSKNWDKIKDRDKSRNFFMINRIMAIEYPLQAGMFNHIKIQPDRTIDWWRDNISRIYKNSPKWIFTSTIKRDRKEKEEFLEEVIQFIKEKYNISSREVKEIQEFYPEKFSAWVKEIKEIYF